MLELIDACILVLWLALFMLVHVPWIHTHASLNVCGCVSAFVCTCAHAPAHDLAFSSPAMRSANRKKSLQPSDRPVIVFVCLC